MATDIKTTITITNEREDDAAMLGSLTEAFGEALDLAPGLLAVQRGLLGGLALSQRREVKRLARTLDKDDPRLRAAMARTQAFERLRDDAETGLQQGGRVADNVNQPGVFFGYVRQADGTAAPGLEVRLQLQDEVFKGELFKARTDEHGFFRIQLPIDQIDNWTRAKGSIKTGEVIVGASTTTGRASVHDEKGQELLRDPLPPTFEEHTSEMRLYTLGMDAGARR
jgi:hypothetical protein